MDPKEEAARDRCDELAPRVVERASGLGVKVSFAESLTAGLIAATVADIPGASNVLLGSAVTYCDEIKHRVLDVSQQTLLEHSAVSHECAREMAKGSRALYRSDIAVSATGYAGPGGGTDEDPAGTFYLGLSVSSDLFGEQGERSFRYTFEGSRTFVRLMAVQEALKIVLDCLDSLK